MFIILPVAVLLLAAAIWFMCQCGSRLIECTESAFSSRSRSVSSIAAVIFISAMMLLNYSIDNDFLFTTRCTESFGLDMLST